MPSDQTRPSGKVTVTKWYLVCGNLVSVTPSHLEQKLCDPCNGGFICLGVAVLSHWPITNFCLFYKNRCFMSSSQCEFWLESEWGHSLWIWKLDFFYSFLYVNLILDFWTWIRIVLLTLSNWHVVIYCTTLHLYDLYV